MQRKFEWGTVFTDEPGTRYLYAGPNPPHQHRLVHVEQGVVRYRLALDEQLGSLYWPLDADAEVRAVRRELADVKRERDALAGVLRRASSRWPKLRPKLEGMYREALA